jgi:high affinity sulfate transporter 1
MAKGRVPILDWLWSYHRSSLGYDLLAGLTTAAVVLPKSMAYAAIAGLPVQVGLYTTFIPIVIYAVLGTSRPLSVSTTTTIAILTANELEMIGPNASTATLAMAASALALMVGAILVVASVLRLGVIANFISEPVLIGFKAGIGLVIVVDQIPKLLGIHFDKGSFLQNILAIFHHLPERSTPTFVLGAVTVVFIFVVEHYAARVPAVLLAVAGGIAASALFGLPARGVAAVGDIPKGLPGFSIPDLKLAGSMWAGAAGIALMSFTESIASGRAFARRGEPRPAPNRELIALGAANIGAGLFGAMAAGGGTSQTAVNRKGGARTQLAALVTAAVAVATLLFLAPVVALMPSATLAGVVIATSIPLIQPREFRAVLKVRRLEFYWALIALAGVVVLGTLRGILVAVIASLLSLMQQAQDPHVFVLGRKKGTAVFRPRTAEHPDDETFPGLLILLIEGRLYFGNAQRAGEKMWALVQKERPKVVLIDCSGVLDFEYSVLVALLDTDDRMRAEGIALWLAALNPVARAVVERSPIGRRLGRERMHFNTETAVAKYLQKGATA